MTSREVELKEILGQFCIREILILNEGWLQFNDSSDESESRTLFYVLLTLIHWLANVFSPKSIADATPGLRQAMEHVAG